VKREEVKEERDELGEKKENDALTR